MYAIVHDTFEPSQEPPVVRHVFVGRTKELARRFYDAHRASDRFMRECDDKGRFDARVSCTTRQRTIELEPRQLRALNTGRLGQNQTCPVNFWAFAGTTMVGSLAALGARKIVHAAVSEREHPETRATAATFAGIGAFWIFAGLTWVLINRRAS